MQVFDFTLSDDDMRLVESINKSWRVLIPMKEVSKSSLSNLSLPLLSLFTQSPTHSLTLPVLQRQQSILKLGWLILHHAKP